MILVPGTQFNSFTDERSELDRLDDALKQIQKNSFEPFSENDINTLIKKSIQYNLFNALKYDTEQITGCAKSFRTLFSLRLPWIEKIRALLREAEKAIDSFSVEHELKRLWSSRVKSAVNLGANKEDVSHIESQLKTDLKSAFRVKVIERLGYEFTKDLNVEAELTTPRNSDNLEQSDELKRFDNALNNIFDNSREPFNERDVDTFIENGIQYERVFLIQARWLREAKAIIKEMKNKNMIRQLEQAFELPSLERLEVYNVPNMKDDLPVVIDIQIALEAALYSLQKTIKDDG